MFEFEAYEVLKIKEFTFVNDCFQNKHNRANTRGVFEPACVKLGHYRQTLNKWDVLTGKIKTEIEEFWALKDVSFEVKQGEVLG